MNTCIYLKKSEPDVSFEKQEHIFPAGLGGISKLEKGYVSDEVNEKFSSELEVDFMRNSILAIPRQMLGPGSRGNVNNIEKASKSKVHLMKDSETDEFTLGYIVLGEPVTIRQIIFDFDEKSKLKNKNTVILPSEIKNDMSEELKKFLELDDKIHIISDNNILGNKVILGLHEYKEKGKGKVKTKWFIAHNKKMHINDNIKSKIKERLLELYNESKVGGFNNNIISRKVVSNQLLEFNVEKFYRTCAKIAFNYIASILKKDVMLKKEFNPIRNYIINGGKNKFVLLPEYSSYEEFNLFNKLKNKHSIIADFLDEFIIVVISFYGSFEIGVRIPYKKDWDELPENRDIFGMIIDWENREEYDMIKYFSREVLEFEDKNITRKVKYKLYK